MLRQSEVPAVQYFINCMCVLRKMWGTIQETIFWGLGWTDGNFYTHMYMYTCICTCTCICGSIRNCGSTFNGNGAMAALWDYLGDYMQYLQEMLKERQGNNNTTERQSNTTQLARNSHFSKKNWHVHPTLHVGCTCEYRCPIHINIKCYITNNNNNNNMNMNMNMNTCDMCIGKIHEPTPKAQLW